MTALAAPAVGPARAQDGPLGVYVHVPFCATRCDYCDFATWTDRGELIDEYVAACVSDVEGRVVRGELGQASTVFFGGGTPSLLDADALARILDAIPRRPDAEVTVECNPDSVDLAKLRSYQRSGVNRCSFGAQSMRPHVLAALGRTHDPSGVARALDAARRAGIERLNVDLIYGGAGETLDDWSATLDAALALGPTHVSAYALTVEPGTPLGARVAAGECRAPDDDAQAEKYELADDRLTAAGYGWYEISNWARPGDECRHHLLYWAQGDYLGIGCAAHGHAAGTRTWNVRRPERYIERIRAGATPVAGAERLDDATRADEALGLALRTRAGAPVPAGAQAAVAELVDAGL
ncbi:MAG TPA: radical SAM family heme chaperone HemW, partial [Acidimicrobiia bacterium]|nr:radical SAM family heme chaperone HemW [Acidimicrobiia bacterium]